VIQENRNPINAKKLGVCTIFDKRSWRRKEEERRASEEREKFVGMKGKKGRGRLTWA